MTSILLYMLEERNNPENKCKHICDCVLYFVLFYLFVYFLLIKCIGSISPGDLTILLAELKDSGDWERLCTYVNVKRRN